MVVVRLSLTEYYHLRRQVEPLFGFVDVGKVDFLILASAGLAVGIGLVEVFADDAAASLVEGHLVVGNERGEAFLDVVGRDIDAVGELVVNVCGFGVKIRVGHALRGFSPRWMRREM
jgi:hypothetical protein